MQKIFEEAQSLFNKNDLVKARTHYAMCVGARDLSQEQQNTAKLMVAYLWLKQGDVIQAYTHLTQCDLSVILTSMPTKVNPSQLKKEIRSALLTSIDKETLTVLDLSQQNITSDLFQELFEVLSKKHPQYHIDFSNNPLNVDDVEKLLDVYLLQNELHEINLTGLPVNAAVFKKLIKLLQKINSDQVKTPPSFTIKMNDFSTDCDVKLLSQALNKITTEKIFIEISNKKSVRILASRAATKYSKDRLRLDHREKLNILRENSDSLYNQLISHDTLADKIQPNGALHLEQKSQQLVFQMKKAHTYKDKLAKIVPAVVFM